MSDRTSILNILKNQRPQQILYLIYVLGSEKGDYFSRSDLQKLLSSNSTETSTINKLLPIFVKNGFLGELKDYKSGKQLMPMTFGKNKKYILAKYINELEEYYTLELNRGKMHSNEVPLYVPKFHWLDDVFGFELNENQKEFIKNIFSGLSQDYIKGKYTTSFEFKKDFKVDLLEIIKKGIFDYLTLFSVGYSLYGDKLNDARKIYQEEWDKESKKLTDKTGTFDFYNPLVVVNTEIPITLNKYNFTLLLSILSCNQNISGKEIKDLASYFIKNKKNNKKQFLDNFDLNSILWISLEGYPDFDNFMAKLNKRKAEVYGTKKD